MYDREFDRYAFDGRRLASLIAGRQAGRQECMMVTHSPTVWTALDGV